MISKIHVVLVNYRSIAANPALYALQYTALTNKMATPPKKTIRISKTPEIMACHWTCFQCCLYIAGQYICGVLFSVNHPNLCFYISFEMTIRLD